jgi:hypothetical protein
MLGQKWRKRVLVGAPPVDGAEWRLWIVLDPELHLACTALVLVLPTRCSPMSTPPEVPPEVMNLPSSIHRFSTYVAPRFSRILRYAQWVVARRPSRRPAAARSSEPVPTEQTRFALSPQSARTREGSHLPKPDGAQPAARHEDPEGLRYLIEGALRD